MTSPRFSLVPAVYLVVRRRREGRREVLLQFRDGTGFMDQHWACAAAGHVEAGETLFQAAVREAREELGIEIEEAALVPLTVVHRRHEDAEPVNQRLDVYFAVDRWSGEPTTREPEKSSALQWFDLEELPEPVVPHEERVLHGLATGDLSHVNAWGFELPADGAEAPPEGSDSAAGDAEGA